MSAKSEWITDDSGEGMWMKRTKKNRLICNRFDSEVIDNMYKIPLRPDDIMMCSYAKCGSHWIWENLRMLLTGRVTADNVEKDATMMENFKSLEHVPSPRLLNNHVHFDDQPRDLLKGENKLIFLYRNPKDVALSLYHHQSKLPLFEYNGKFSNFQKRFVKGNVLDSSYFDYLNAWEEGLKQHTNIPCLIVRYEDFHENPISERRRLAQFVGRDYDDAFLQEVANATTIDAMRRLKADASLKSKDGGSVLYRKGKVGDWKDNFTVSESEWFDKCVEREMKGSSMFPFVYSLD